MGSGNFDVHSYAKSVRAVTQRADGTAKSVSEVFTSQSIHPMLDPSLMPLKQGATRSFLRECRASSDHPDPTPIIIGLDVSGTMGEISRQMVESGLGTVMQRLLNTSAVTDPQLMFMAIGDVVAYDRAPLQVSQFESDNRIIDQLLTIFQEGRGGGNGSESYTLPWLFADAFIDSDSFGKKKGVIITIGDELVPPHITLSEASRVFSSREQQHELRNYFSEHAHNYRNSPDGSLRILNQTLFDQVSRNWEVLHIIVEQGNYACTRKQQVVDNWRSLIGKRAIPLSDTRYLPEVIVASLLLLNGATPDQLFDASAEAPECVDTLTHAFGC